MPTRDRIPRPAPATTASAQEVAGSQTLRALLGVRQAILDGELLAGQRVSEEALALRLGVSRTPVRSALSRLADEGLLETLPGSGYAVRSFSEADIADAIEIRGTLEGLAARLAAERGVAPDLLAAFEACLLAIDVLLETPIDDAQFARYVALNARFHELLGQASGSAVVRHQLERAQSLPFASPNGFVRVQATLPSSPWVLRLAQEQHRSLVEAIRSAQGSRAEALAREHARIALRHLRAALRDRDALARLPGAGLIRSARGR